MTLIEICENDYECYNNSMYMTKYITEYGWHFNEKLCNFATERMTKGGKSINVIDKDSLDLVLAKYNISVNTSTWDYVYIANMCKADFLGSSVIGEEGLAKFVYDYMNDSDGYNGTAMNRWYADMLSLCLCINWEEMI